jgi:alpha-tubulin suppressor-like RCC1 family protein
MDGRLGYGVGLPDDVGDNELPASVGHVNIGGEVKQLSAGSHTCALLTTGRVRCWGNNGSGQLGYGHREPGVGVTMPPAGVGDVDVGGEVAQISVGSKHTCALLTNGKVRCWGYGAYGQLGYVSTQSIGDNETPASAGDVDVGGPVKQIATDGDRTCALLETGNVRCWGRGDGYGIGYGNTDTIGDNETPASAGDIDVDGPVKQLTMGQSHICALLETGRIRCWGEGRQGQLGYGNEDRIGDDETPASAGDVPVF